MIVFIILTFLFCQTIGAVGVYTKNELAGQDEFHPLSLPGVTG
jgi:hypothetical protein